MYINPPEIMFENRYRYGYVFSLALYSFLNILIINEDRLYIFELSPAIHFLNILALVLLIWEGNRLLLRHFAKKIKPEKPRKFVVHFFLSILWVALLAVVSVSAGHYFMEKPLTNYLTNLKLTMGFSFRVNLFLNTIHVIVFYVRKYKEKDREADQLKIKTVESQYEALRNQVNPHFLFNSLNVLMSLVHKNPQKAEEFLHKLSDVYRYTLQNRQTPLVSLREELEFIEAYYYLVKIRFRDGISMEHQISPEMLDRYLPPSTLQIILEYFTKHNFTHKEQPLSMRIYTHAGFLVLESSAPPGFRHPDPDQEMSLNNLQLRYDLLTDQMPEIENPSGILRVKLPLLEIQAFEKMRP